MAKIAAPAIVRGYTNVDADVEVLQEFYNSVSFTRGLGDSGYKLQVVEHDCPEEYCKFDRMVRRVDVYPEMPDEVRYWCLNPACVHYVGEKFRYARARSDALEPTIFE